MVKKRPFDWEALRAYIKSVEALPKGNQIPVTEELKFFVRFRRFTSRWAQVADPIAAESAMIDLAEELRLDWRRAARLYVRLQQQASLHILGRDLDASNARVMQARSCRQSGIHSNGSKSSQNVSLLKLPGQVR